MSAVHEVKIVEGDSTLHLIATLGPLFVALAAIAAAIIAWRSAGSRLEKELRHDRSARREDHQRDVLDSVIELQETAYYALSRYIGLRRKLGRERDSMIAEAHEDGAERAEIEEHLPQFSAALTPSIDETEALWEGFSDSLNRLKIRFYKHPVSRTAHKVNEQWKLLEPFVEATRTDFPSEEEREKVGAGPQARPAPGCD